MGLILPAMTRVQPKLTPFAAIGLTLVMILAAGAGILCAGLVQGDTHHELMARF